MTPSAGAEPGPSHGDRAARRAVMVAGVAGTLHALASLYWALGGTWLLATLGARVLEAFAGLEWVLLPVAVVKLTGAWVPVVLHQRQWPHARFWRPVCWVGAGVLIAWGGSNTMVGQVVLAGVLQPEGGYDRAAMIGHAWLWDPLFLLWGAALAVGLWLSRPTPEREDLSGTPAETVDRHGG